MRFLALLPAFLVPAVLALAAPQPEPNAEHVVDVGGGNQLARRQATITSAPLFATGGASGATYTGTTNPGGPVVNPGNYTMPTSLTAVPTNPPTSSGGSAAAAASSSGSKSSAGRREAVMGGGALIGVGAMVVAHVMV